MFNKKKQYYLTNFLPICLLLKTFVNNANMKKLYFGKIIDNWFLFVILTFIFFVWLRYFVYNLLTCLLLSILLGYGSYKIITILLTKRNNKQQLTKQKAIQIQTTKNNLLFATWQDNIAFFESIIKKHINCIVQDRSILLEKDNSALSIYPYFDQETLNKTALLAIYKQQKNMPSKLIILCCDVDKETSLLASTIATTKISILTIEEVFLKLLEPTNSTPPQKVIFEKQKRYTLKALFDIAFCKQKTKGYLICGLIFFICSWFVRYSLYYVIMSSLLFCFAIFSYFNKKHTLPRQ